MKRAGGYKAKVSRNFGIFIARYFTFIVCALLSAALEPLPRRIGENLQFFCKDIAIYTRTQNHL